MEFLYKKVIDIVEEESLCLEEFLELLVNQQKYLVENDLEKLKDGVARQQEIISRVKTLEKQRGKLVAEYSETEDVNPGDITITCLARKAGGQIADKLLELQNSLLSLHEKIEKARRKNEFLIENSMKYIDGTIRLIAESGRQKEDNAKSDEKESLILTTTV
ncbi:MAG: flagellar protein FlgN [candidate division Zixibacteria bacterium]|nr:flagellar protein FlgN [candidate division Zixibacteria bacterium]NIR67721.1 flagellar protein FlgN [candidate division Zixibacteria bacterium]NIS16787.1 flagellar protein FlgN [candidate division Zixibacteria bacterium]NIS48974.1 flagellar protein FlgN [candidate division Zixibacteria bacterium]NIT53190.1 flagellar protein FlgN [candidate division Zixibacteria bacterium]